MDKYGIHVGVGALAFLSTLLISMGNNTFATSIVRASFGFLIFFLVMFPVSWGFRWKARESNEIEKMVGQKIDAQTPEENILKQFAEDKPADQQKTEDSTGFVPLAPPTIKRKTNKESTMDAEQMANAVRILSNQ